MEQKKQRERERWRERGQDLGEKKVAGRLRKGRERLISVKYFASHYW